MLTHDTASPLINEDDRTMPKILGIPCHAQYHLQSKWYLAEGLLPRGWMHIDGTSWCACCWRRYLLICAGHFLHWHALYSLSGCLLISEGRQSWRQFAYEATQEQACEAWLAVPEPARLVVDGIDRTSVGEEAL